MDEILPIPNGCATGPLVERIVSAVLHAITESLPSGPLFSDVIARFRAEEMPERYSTRAGYESMLKKWIEPRWSEIPISSIRTSDIELWLKSMPSALKTRQHRKALMHALFNSAVRWELAASNPVDLVRIRGGCKRRGRPFLITLGEFSMVLSHLQQPWRQMALLAGLLGLRASEVVALRWSDFDFTAGTLLVQRASVSRRVSETKTESSRDLLPIDGLIAKEMLRYRETKPKSVDDWVFPSPVTGGPYHQDTVRYRHLNPAGRAAGLTGSLGWHTFRHSYRRWLDENGTPLGLIKELMRHAHISTTMDIYGVGTLTPAKRSAHRAFVRTAFSDAA